MDLEGRIWSLGLRREEELVERVRRREKQSNNVWEQSPDPKHVIYHFRSGVSGRIPGVSGLIPGVSGYFSEVPGPIPEVPVSPDSRK